MKYIVTILIGCFLYLNAHAQDPRFAQFYAAPDQLNPALNVVYEGKFRFIANYRDQWASVLDDVPYRTIAAHVDARFNVGKNDYLAVGFSGLRDEAGSSNFTQNANHLNVAFMKYLGGSSKKSYYLVAGAQGGIGQRSIDANRLWFSQQFDQENVLVNQNLPSGEVVNQQSDLYPDFSAGVLWYTIAGDNSFYIGGAMYHLNAPNVSLFENQQDFLLERYVGHLGGELSMNRNVSLLPAAAVQFQGPSMDVNVGTNLRFTSGDLNDLALRIGGWAHVTNRLDDKISLEAFTVTAMLEMEMWMLGLSYDINVSQLTPASNSRGAFEASFIYLIPETKRRGRVSCPKF